VLSLWAKFQALERVCGAAEALRLARASAAAVTEIGAFCREHDIDAHFRAEGWLWAATNRSQVRRGLARAEVEAEQHDVLLEEPVEDRKALLGPEFARGPVPVRVVFTAEITAFG
jgi:hypothetical protein